MLLYLSIALFFWSGCSDQGVDVPTVDGHTPLDASINGMQLTTGVNARFSLELEVLADAGYQWECSVSDRSVLQLDSVSFRTAAVPPVEGGPVYETFYFRTKGEGSCSVRLIQRQGWQPATVPPRETLSFLLYVRR